MLLRAVRTKTKVTCASVAPLLPNPQFFSPPGLKVLSLRGTTCDSASSAEAASSNSLHAMSNAEVELSLSVRGAPSNAPLSFLMPDVRLAGSTRNNCRNLELGPKNLIDDRLTPDVGPVGCTRKSFPPGVSCLDPTPRSRRTRRRLNRSCRWEVRGQGDVTMFSVRQATFNSAIEPSASARGAPRIQAVKVYPGRRSDLQEEVGPLAQGPGGPILVVPDLRLEGGARKNAMENSLCSPSLCLPSLSGSPNPNLEGFDAGAISNSGATLGTAGILDGFDADAISKSGAIAGLLDGFAAGAISKSGAITGNRWHVGGF